MMEWVYLFLLFVSLFGVMFCIYLLKCLHRMGKIQRPETVSKELPYYMWQENQREWERYWRYVLTGSREY